MDVEKTIEFILDGLARLTAHIERHDVEIAAAQRNLVRAQEELAKKQRELADSQARSDARLEALINIVDRMQRRPETGP